MVFEEHSQETLRAQVYDSAIKQIAKYAYKFKQLVSVVTTGAWKNYFFREQLTKLAGKTGNATKGIPRGAAFPHATLSWERVVGTIEKYGLEDSIPYEDIVSNEIDVRDRSLLRIAEGVTYAVDSEIFEELSESFKTGMSLASIQSYGYSAGGWEYSSAAIVKDIANAKRKIRSYYDSAKDFVLVVNGDDEVNIMHYLYEKGSQAPQVGTQMALNGDVTKIAGVTVVVSDIMPTSYAMLLVPKRCATWKELLPLSTDVEERMFKDIRITACEMGITQVTDPKAIVLLGTAPGHKIGSGT